MGEDSKKTTGLDLGWKISVFVLIFGVLFIVFVVLFQYNDYSSPKKADISQVQIADSDSYRFYVDTISGASSQGEYIYVSGWAVHLGEDLIHYNMYLVLYEDSLEDALVFKLAMKTRSDVTSYFDDGFDYDSSGFAVNLKSSLFRNGPVYNVAILYNDTQTDDGARLILTGTTLTGKE